MKIHLHQTKHPIADFKNIARYVREQVNSQQEGLHLFSECFLFGYPAQDIWFQPEPIHRYLQMLQELDEFFSNQKPNPNTLFLLGAPEYQMSPKTETPQKIFNSLYTASPGLSLSPCYRKKSLPNYDIFNESRYFTRGTENKIIDFMGKRIGLLICEDMWPSNHYSQDAASHWAEKGETLDLVINLSASPFHIGKMFNRVKLAKEVSQQVHAPIAYVNRVGGEDEVLFDGGSFILNGNQVIAQCPFFTEDILSLDLPEKIPPNKREKKIQFTVPGHWESLFRARLDPNNPLTLKPLDFNETESIQNAIRFGLQEYAEKNFMKKFLVALSGGLDSALTLALAKLSLRKGQSLEALIMPGLYSSPKSHELSKELCANLGVPLKVLPIKFLHAACRNTFTTSLNAPLEGLADENIQSRLRGMLLYSRANQTGAMVINTSNKSELSVGYNTQYGDSVGALSILGDLYKTEIYQLAEHLNQFYETKIPEGILSRPPSAELKEGQKDSDSLPPYPILDAILEGFLSHSLTPKQLVSIGHHEKSVEKVIKLYEKSEFKRFQFCPILKVKVKSYGSGYRVPISKASVYKT